METSSTFWRNPRRFIVKRSRRHYLRYPESDCTPHATSERDSRRRPSLCRDPRSVRGAACRRTSENRLGARLSGGGEAPRPGLGLPCPPARGRKGTAEAKDDARGRCGTAPVAALHPSAGFPGAAPGPTRPPRAPRPWEGGRRRRAPPRAAGARPRASGRRRGPGLPER